MLIYADFYYFFSSGHIEPFWTYQNVSSWEDVHLHSPPIYGRSIKGNSEERQLMKRVGIFQVGIFWVGIFRVGEFSSGEFDGWGFSGWEFSPRGIFLEPIRISKT